MNPDLIAEVVLFVATEDELEQLRYVATRLLDLPFEEKVDQRVGTFYMLGQLGSNRVIAARTRTGAHDYKGSATQTFLFQTYSTAKSYVQLGMAFGVSPGLQRVGDILVAKSLFPYDRREVYLTRDGIVYQYEYAKRRNCNRTLLRIFQRAAEQIRQFRSRVHFGMLLSGGARIYSPGFRDRLIRWVPQKPDHPVVGGEMEGVGLLAGSNPDNPSWIVVKGICDFADNFMPENPARPAACRRAASFVLRALIANPDPVD
jgi:adenosylhomocysteine nucleosidase